MLSVLLLSMSSSVQEFRAGILGDRLHILQFQMLHGVLLGSVILYSCPETGLHSSAHK